MSQLTKEQEVLILKYNDEKGMLAHKKEQRRLQFFYYSIFFLTYGFCLYFLKAEVFDLGIMLLISAFAFSVKCSENLIRKATRRSRYQGFGVVSDCYNWLSENILNIESKDTKPPAIFRIFPILAVGYFVFMFSLCLAVHGIIFYFFSWNLFIFAVLPTFLASIYAWIDGGYRDAWKLTEARALFFISNFLIISHTRIGISEDRKNWLKNNCNSTKVEEIIYDMKRDKKINWVFEKTHR